MIVYNRYMTTYVLGGGCFWCLDAVFRRLKGVTSVVSGYAGGDVKNPTYYQVSGGNTGHAEVIELTFDETIIPPSVILDIFFAIHDPTTLNRQGADVGSQYRSVMLYVGSEQKAVFDAACERIGALWDRPVVTEIKPLDVFYPAEPEHQDYFNKNPETGYCQVVINPKVTKMRNHFKEWLQPA